MSLFVHPEGDEVTKTSYFPAVMLSTQVDRTLPLLA
jgi:hypothetical protein